MQHGPAVTSWTQVYAIRPVIDAITSIIDAIHTIIDAITTRNDAIPQPGGWGSASNPNFPLHKQVPKPKSPISTNPRPLSEPVSIK
ncbi:hypothetical protein [Bacillus sp. FJAT-27251]|uniref:hypothetical protein n=1 Tax=Bacillus sp. FJAT-27251 TaxID=1684142 RepID=UPI0012E18CE6|nr:hypothetical protein [Bacillus sp. FJAT-27251]